MLLYSNVRWVVVDWLLQDLAQTFKLNWVSYFSEFLLEFQNLFLWTGHINCVEEQMYSVWHSLWTLLLCPFLLFHKWFRSVKVSRLKRLSIMPQELNNLFDIRAWQTFATAKPFCCVQKVSAVVKRKFSHDSVTELYIKDMVIFTCSK
jgi:hypothetical protein